MLKRLEQVAGGMPSGNGSSGEVCANRLSAASTASKNEMSEAVGDDPDRVEALVRGKGAGSHASVTTKCAQDFFSLLISRPGGESRGLLYTCTCVVTRW
jgi:hypothetical protein